MKVNFNKALVTLAGDPIRDNGMEVTMLNEAAKLAKGRQSSNVAEASAILDAEKVTFTELIQKQGEPFTLKACLANLLVGRRAQSEKELDGAEVIRRFNLADKLWGAKEAISIKAEDIVLLKELLQRAYNDRLYSTLIIGQAMVILESDGVAEVKVVTPTIPKE